ncbi:6-hydroxymethylpterin diphosphokinase MptE-like protein [Nitrosopumilus sp.]|uniref:6-hydroxymethylpterin diphosphokinase MptE-like protein n=1 Tax=Nitrosopumilus sp. TaxID=2024843 RepID=UPI003D0D7AC9
MSEDSNFELQEGTFLQLKQKKQEMGYEHISWDKWFRIAFELDYHDSDKQIIEKIFQKNNLEKYYNGWIRNFADNLTDLSNGDSLHQLVGRTQNDKKEISSIVIGRGPSLMKNNHLEILKKSDFSGNIICTDGVLPLVLKSGITPEKFENFYVVTIDVQEHQKKFYQEEIVKKFGNKIKCMLSSTVPNSTYQAIIQNKIKVFWFHALVDYNQKSTSFNHIIGLMSKNKKHPKGFPALQTGGNVGTTSWILAWTILKSKKVCLIGLDQGYPVNTPLEQLEHYNLPDSVDKQSISFKKAYPIVYNPEFNCECRQTPLYQYYCNAFKEFIEKTSDRVVTINATEGGALFGKGIKCMKFSEFLQN